MIALKKACPKKGWPLLTYEKHRHKNRRKNIYANFKLFNFFKYNKVAMYLLKKHTQNEKGMYWKKYYGGKRLFNVNFNRQFNSSLIFFLE